MCRCASPWKCHEIIRFACYESEKRVSSRLGRKAQFKTTHHLVDMHVCLMCVCARVCVTVNGARRKGRQRKRGEDHHERSAPKRNTTQSSAVSSSRLTQRAGQQKTESPARVVAKHTPTCVWHAHFLTHVHDAAARTAGMCVFVQSVFTYRCWSNDKNTLHRKRQEELVLCARRSQRSATVVPRESRGPSHILICVDFIGCSLCLRRVSISWALSMYVSVARVVA